MSTPKLYRKPRKPPTPKALAAASRDLYLALRKIILDADERMINEHDGLREDAMWTKYRRIVAILHKAEGRP